MDVVIARIRGWGPARFEHAPMSPACLSIDWVPKLRIAMLAGLENREFPFFSTFWPVHFPCMGRMQ
mgnify:CR=1 FL=1